MSSPEQWPVPCNRCGAAMVMTGQPSPYGGAVMMGCRFCGAVEPLPLEASERVRVAHERLNLLKMAHHAAEAPARALDAMMKQRPWMLGLAFGAFGLLNGLSQLGTQWQAISGAGLDEGARAGLIFQTLGLTLGSAGFGVGGYVGWWYALKAYRAAVEPTRWARPPLRPDGAARCRCCGAELTMQWGASVGCGYCGTVNFLDRAIIDRRDVLLADETLAHQQRAAGVIARGNLAYQNFGRYWWVGGLAGAAAMLAVAGAVAALS
ncbi:MAG: hypothetical protein JNK72_10660 [Myxococcales bacterium]|nr:hypothetical protein [Myxococcales bacterium]